MIVTIPDGSSGAGSGQGGGGGVHHPLYNEDEGWRFVCHRYVGTWTVAALAILAFVSPLAMIVIPKTQALGLKHNQMVCEVRLLFSLYKVFYVLLLFRNTRNSVYVLSL